MSKLLKAFASGGNVRVYITNTTDITNDAIIAHDLYPSAASVLGKTMTIALMMGSMMKGEEALTIKINGNGPIGNVIVDSNAKGTVRGYVDNPHVHFSRGGKLDDITTLGYNGYYDIIKDLKLKDLYSSTIAIQTGDLAKDFTYYFAASEQTPSLVALASTINEDNTAKVTGGVIIQLMPGASETDIVAIEEKMGLLENLSDLLLKHKNLEDILALICSDYQVLEEIEVKFYCPCSWEGFYNAIKSIGKEGILHLLENEDNSEVVCHYCNTRYEYTHKDLNKLLEDL